MPSSSDDDQARLEELRRLWGGCGALRLLIPDWDEFEQMEIDLKNDPGEHRSMINLAFQRGILGRITVPIHRYLVNNPRPATNQYIKALREDWMKAATPARRHERSKIYSGKLMELQLAQWLEGRCYRITNLEAWGGAVDIEARRLCRDLAIEVKYIGDETAEFVAIHDSLVSGSHVTAGTKSLRACANFLLFKVVEAADQLRKVKRSGVAAIVVSEYLSWPSFEFVLKNGYIDSNRPRFLDHAGKEWDDFLTEKKLKTPDIERDARDLVLGYISQVWVFRHTGHHENLREFTFRPGKERAH